MDGEGDNANENENNAPECGQATEKSVTMPQAGRSV